MEINELHPGLNKYFSDAELLAHDDRIVVSTEKLLNLPDDMEVLKDKHAEVLQSYQDEYRAMDKHNAYLNGIKDAYDHIFELMFDKK